MIFRSLRLYRISRPWILLCSSAVRVQLSHSYRKVDKMSVRISLALGAREMFLSLHICFSLERAAVVWAILESVSGLDPSLEMIDPRYLKLFFTSSSFWPFILISLWKQSGLFVTVFVLSGPIVILYPVQTVSILVTMSSASSLALTTMPSAKRKLMKIRPPMLALVHYSCGLAVHRS